jgi:hypothetical protein
MTQYFQNVNIDIPPLIGDPFDYTKDWPKGRQDKLYDKQFLNPALLSFFESKGIRIRENFIVWWWHTKVARYPHTDGDWFSPEELVKRRPCGLNWNFSPNTWVEFYSIEGATPKADFRSEYDFSTTWTGITKEVTRWDTSGPVVFNPQVPHMIKSGPGVFKRLSMTLRFYETYESLISKLNAGVVSEPSP